MQEIMRDYGMALFYSVIGGSICGGYQMLGKNLSDPYGVEEGGDTAGLGL